MWQERYRLCVSTRNSDLNWHHLEARCVLDIDIKSSVVEGFAHQRYDIHVPFTACKMQGK